MSSRGRRGSGPSIPQVSSRAPNAPDGWHSWPLGARVVVRRRLAEGGYSDVLGVLLARDDAGVLVATRTGEVHVPAAQIAVGRLVPPPPAARKRR